MTVVCETSAEDKNIYYLRLTLVVHLENPELDGTAFYAVAQDKEHKHRFKSAFVLTFKTLNMYQRCMTTTADRKR